MHSSGFQYHIIMKRVSDILETHTISIFRVLIMRTDERCSPKETVGKNEYVPTGAALLNAV
jgi:hypothetical protein